MGVFSRELSVLFRTGTLNRVKPICSKRGKEEEERKLEIYTLFSLYTTKVARVYVEYTDLFFWVFQVHLTISPITIQLFGHLPPLQPPHHWVCTWTTGRGTHIEIACIQLHLLLQLGQKLIVERLQLDDTQKHKSLKAKATT